MPQSTIIGTVSLSEETLGRMLRQASVVIAEQIPDAKPAWLVEYDKLPKGDREYHDAVSTLFLSFVIQAMEDKELLQTFREGTIIGGH